MAVNGLGQHSTRIVYSIIYRGCSIGIFVTIFFLYIVSHCSASSVKVEQYIESQITTLSSAYKLLMTHENGPVISLATLFNGSGRVAADEFEKTIRYLQGHYSIISPWSLGFISKSHPPSCRNRLGCWMVAYSTDISGALRPGADADRFTPLKQTIDLAIKDENNLVVGPVFEGQFGSQYSYYGVTVQNTRQFGVLVSLIDYQAIIENMNLKELGNIDITIENVSSDKRLMLKAQPLIRASGGAEEDNFITENIVIIANTSYKLRWFYRDN
ncbi:MAG: hypothetical protein CMM25_06030 [Rhodospirillaceae bacterium]|nr:hypothetical protein [Rhodospirillaceae bacterium]|tara:strand:- start:223 stop:1035 length:813 start_codon:yes stop_codon:yes gene_type:complete